MSAFPVVSLEPAPRTRAVVLIFFAHVDHGANFRTIVAGNDHERVVRESRALSSFSNN